MLSEELSAATIDALEADVTLLAHGTGTKPKMWRAFLETIGELRAHNVEMYAHSLRVGVLAHRVADAEDGDVRACLYGGCGHDIGKCAVPNTLLRAENLDEAGFAQIKVHPGAGYERLRDRFLFSGFVAGLHHAVREGGYGIDLAADAPFPVSAELAERVVGVARIVCIADFYDALTTRKNQKGLLTNPGDRDEQRAVMDRYFPDDTARLDVLFS